MDGVVLVVRPNEVLRSAVEDSIDFLEKSGIPVIGSILNCKTEILRGPIKRDSSSQR